MKKIVLLLITACFVLLACTDSDQPRDSGSIPPPQPSVSREPSDITPLMWQVTSPSGAQVYLFGSIHAGTPDIYPLPTYIYDAFLRSNYLAVEINLGDFESDFAAQMEFAAMVAFTDGRTIADVVEPDLLAELRELLQPVVDETPMMSWMIMDMMKPMMWWQTLTQRTLELSSLDVEHGLDRHFEISARERGIPILELESWQSQFNMLLDFSDELMSALLQNAVAHSMEDSVEGLELLWQAWQRGDYDEITERLNEECDCIDCENFPQHLYDEYNNAMLIDRDILMTQVIREYLANEQAVFVVAGLAHFMGDDSIIYLLRNYGYTVDLVTP